MQIFSTPVWEPHSIESQDPCHADPMPWAPFGPDADHRGAVRDHLGEHDQGLGGQKEVRGKGFLCVCASACVLLYLSTPYIGLCVYVDK